CRVAQGIRQDVGLRAEVRLQALELTRDGFEGIMPGIGRGLDHQFQDLALVRAHVAAGIAGLYVAPDDQPRLPVIRFVAGHREGKRVDDRLEEGSHGTLGIGRLLKYSMPARRKTDVSACGWMRRLSITGPLLSMKSS